MHYFTKGIVFLMIITLSALANAFSCPVGNSSPMDCSGYYDELDFEEQSTENWKYHLGEDWNIYGGVNDDCGEPIYAISGGVIKKAGYYSSSWGNVIIIDHGLVGDKRVESLYGHVNLTESLSEGGVVTWGQKIGEIGGNFNGMTCHLHFETRNEDRPYYPSIWAGPAYVDNLPAPTSWFDPSSFISGHPISATTFWSDTESSMGPWELSDSEYFHVKARIANGSRTAVSVYRVVLALHDEDNDYIMDLYSTYPNTILYSGGTYLINPPTVVMDTSTLDSGDYQVVVKMQRFYGDYWENLGSRDMTID